MADSDNDTGAIPEDGTATFPEEGSSTAEAGASSPSGVCSTILELAH